MTFLRKRWKLLSLALLVLVVLWLGAAYVVAYQLTRRAKPRGEEALPTLAWCAGVEAFRLATSDGQDLGAWFLPGQADKPILLFLHGNGQCRSACLDQAEIAAATGCGLLMVTLRCHGDSSGDFNDIGYSARHDVIAAVDWIEKHHPGKPIVVFGHSLGAAAAAFAAKDLSKSVRGYILDGPYRDLRTAVANRMSLWLPPVLDSVAYAGVVTVAPFVVGDVDQIAPVKAVEGIPPDVPVLVLTGTADRKATKAEAEAIADRLGDRCRLVVVEGGDHGKLHCCEGDTTYRDEILTFVARLAGP